MKDYKLSVGESKMKLHFKSITIFLLIAPLTSCEELRCDCEYVTYDSNPTNNYNWTETFRSS